MIEKKNNYRSAGTASVFFMLMLYWMCTTAWNIYGWHDQQRIAELGLLCILPALSFLALDTPVFTSRADSLPAVFPPSFSPFVLFAGFALCGLASALHARFPHWALLEWALLLSLCMGAFVVARLRQAHGAQFDRALLLVLSGVCAFYLFGFLGRYAVLFEGLPLRVRDMYTGFANPRFFGQFQTMTLPLLAVAAMAGRSSLQRWGAFALLAGWWMLSIVCGTRGTWLAIAAALAAVSLVGRRTGRSWVRRQLAGIAAGLALYGLLFFAIPHLLGNQPDLINRLPELGSLSHRDVLWAEAWRMIVGHPWLGVGPMHFAAVPNGIGAHPHNAVLQIAAEWGVPALLMLLAPVAIGFRRFAVMLRAGHDDASFSRILALSLFAALVAAATQSLVDGVIVMPYSQVTLMAVAGWSMGMCAAAVRADGLAASAAPGWQGALMPIAQLALLAILLRLALPDVPHLPQRMRHYSAAHHTEYFLPRFWQQGWINE